MDPLKAITIACVCALIISVATAITVVWQNRGSKNIALAVGALTGATMLFVIQLRFELQTVTTNEFMLAEFGIDRAKPEIRQWKYRPGSSSRASVEVSASQWLVKHDPKAFDGDREKLTSDLVLFSLATFLQDPESQYWDVQRHSLVGSSSGIVRFHPSANRECTVLQMDNVRSQLTRAKNEFAGALVFGQVVCLPPSSSLIISANSLVIRNHVCEITFTIESSGDVNFFNPGPGEEVPKLPNGQARFETRPVGLDVKIQFFALRIGQKENDKYRRWSSALVGGAREWFER